MHQPSVVAVPLLTFTAITVGGAAVANVAAHAADLSNAPIWEAGALIVAAVIGYIATVRAARQRVNQPETPDVAKRLDRMETKQTQVATSLNEYREATDRRFDDARKETREWLDEIMRELRAQRADRRGQ